MSEAGHDEGGRPAAGSDRRASPLLVLLGIPIGFASSLLGLGGGIFAGPLLHYRFGFELRRATGTALVVVLATTLSSTLSELFRQDSALLWDVALALMAGALLGARLGFAASERIPERPLRAVFALLLLALALRAFLAHESRAIPGAEIASAWTYPWAIAVGFVGGFVSPLLGVGGGLIMVPGLLFIDGLGFDAARAASLAAGAVAAGRALLLKSSVRRVSWPHGLWIGAGATLGGASAVLALERVPLLHSAGRVALASLLVLLALRFGFDALRGARREANQA